MPSNHSSIATTKNNTACVYEKQNRFDEALIKFQEELRIYKEHLPSKYSSIAETVNNIGLVYGKQNRFDEALIKYEEALRIYKETLPSNHSSIASTINNIANPSLTLKKSKIVIFIFLNLCQLLD